MSPNGGGDERPGGGGDELARLRSELVAVDSERRRLRIELEQIERSPLGSLVGPARTVRSVVARYARGLRTRLGGRVARRGPRPGRPNRRLSPQLSGSELAWLARSRLRREASRWRVGERAAPAGPWLTPILVDYFGRDGSTAMMALLATSPEIVVDDKYPYERRYFTYLWRWSRLLSRTDWPHALWTKEDVVSVAQEGEGSTLLGPPPWLPRTLLDVPGEPPIAQRCFELVWRELSTRSAFRDRAGGAVRYYAEKHGNTWLVDLRELPPLRLIVLLRDPRDTYASMRAFEDAEPEASFGIHHVWAGDDRLTGILKRHRRRLRWISALQAEDAAQVIRYEELVSDPDGVSSRLERYLEVELDPEALRDRALIARHATATPDASDRWRRELDPRVAERFNEELGPELDALDFAT